MRRRHVIQSMGLLTAHALFPSILSGFLSSCKRGEANDYQFRFFRADQIPVVVALIDAIIPATSTPSASAVFVHQFMDEVFAKCLTEDRQASMKAGLDQLIGQPGLSHDNAAVIAEIDQKAFSGDPEWEFFKVIKQCALIGYFTSQEGETKASHYVKVPESYQGDIPASAETLNYGKTNLTFNI